MVISLTSIRYCPALLILPSQTKTKTIFQNYAISNKTQILKTNKHSSISCYYSETTLADTSEKYDDDEKECFERVTPTANAPPVLKKRKRYRKEYPGESKGITQEMRFVAMKLRNDKHMSNTTTDDVDTWEPTVPGFLNYLVDSKLMFQTLEDVVEDSNDVSYAYFRKTGLERSECLVKDLEWFGHRNIVIPEPTNAGISYATYLKELGEKSAPLFLSHFYNVYFSHIAGGQVIAKQVAEKLLQGRVLEFYRWEGEEEEFLKEVREKLNKLSEHWSRDDKNKCLKEATKSFRYLGQIVRLIIL